MPEMVLSCGFPLIIKKLLEAGATLVEKTSFGLRQHRTFSRNRFLRPSTADWRQATTRHHSLTCAPQQTIQPVPNHRRCYPNDYANHCDRTVHTRLLPKKIVIPRRTSFEQPAQIKRILRRESDLSTFLPIAAGCSNLIVAFQNKY